MASCTHLGQVHLASITEENAIWQHLSICHKLFVAYQAWQSWGCQSVLLDNSGIILYLSAPNWLFNLKDTSMGVNNLCPLN